MKQLSILLAAILFLHLHTFSQESRDLPRKRNLLTDGQNIQQTKLSPELRQRMQFRNRNFVLLRFNQLPDLQQKQELSRKGVKLFNYLTANAWYAEIPVTLELTQLKPLGVSGVFVPDETLKVAPELEYRTAGPDEGVAVHYTGDISRVEATAELLKAGASLMDYSIQPDNILFLRADTAAIHKIAKIPFVTYVYPQALKDQPLNYLSRTGNNLSSLSNPTGRNLQGKGVTMGNGDQGDPTHADFTGRLINNNPINAAAHAAHTLGTMGGGGILNPKYRGMAPLATLIAEYYSDILVNSPQYVSQYGLVLTNNSYHSSTPGCAGTGNYDALSNYVDAQMVANPSLLHIFASGNDGGLTCSPYLSSYGTVRSGFQSSKNALVVGQYNNSNDRIGGGSSRGPVKDGRLKPEIMAGGVDVMSTYTLNLYGPISGTSMSSPSVTGSLALLYERYRQLHGGANPSAALIKALACNGADDMGNAGPDYLWGFGKLNARASIEMMEQNNYFTGSVTHGNNSTHTITGVPAGTAKLKVMLYWVDPPALPGAPVALVNNLDLIVTGTDAIPHRPLVLNPNPGDVDDPAVEGTDNMNNIEQVVIDAPPAGDVNININGSNIPSGPQQYVVAYQVIAPVITVTYPSGGETMVPGEAEQIRWSAFDNSTNSFTIEYSGDNGSNWTTIDNNVSDTARFYNWTVPAVSAREALVRVTRNSGGITGTSEATFTVLGQPVITATNPCPQYVQLSWAGIPDADNYEILMFVGDRMQTVASTNANTYLLGGLNKDSLYYLAVRPFINGRAGRPSVAASITPSAGTCGTDFDNDITVELLRAPSNGRQFTASQPGTSPVRIRLRNRGTIPSSGPYQLYYQINGGSVISASSSTVIPANNILDYNFSPAEDFSATGDYLIKVWVKYPADLKADNDTLQTLVRHLPNPPITLAPDFTEGFETASPLSYVNKTFGLAGLPRADFAATTSNGRARTFVTGFARTGNNALVLDQSRYNANGNTDSVTLTFNLSGYTSTDQLWLDFFYRNQGIDIEYPNNKVWIRGNDNAAWIPVFSLPATATELGIFKRATSVNITETLAKATPAQTISSSFQVRLGQQGLTSTQTPAPEDLTEDGITYDDIRIYRNTNDVGVRAIINPPIPSVCQLGSAEYIRVELKNYSTVLQTNVEVAYELNGTVVKEYIDLNPGQLVQHQFSAPVDFSLQAKHSIRAWVNMSGDDFVNNDTLQLYTFTTSPVISTFPYLETFESGDGHWYTDGINSSWQYGTPSKPIITRAANGSGAWATGLMTNYNNSEYSYLYSPCFNLNGMTLPVISFSHIYKVEDVCDCDHHWIEYSLDDKTWTKLGAFNDGTNWYNHAAYRTFYRPMLTWHVSSRHLPIVSGKIRLRFVMKSDAGGTFAGTAIDDVHIFDRALVYTGADIPAGITQPVSGNNWTHFALSNNRIVSINPQGQDLGSTTVKLFRNTGAIRNNSGQYYLDRNIVITPSTAPTSNVLVRFYFSDAEAKALIGATNCPSCTKPEDPFMVGITQYSGAASEENGLLTDNATGIYRFIPPADVYVAPYDNGYYAEFPVDHFSEFWVNGGGPTQTAPLPVTLTNFTATRRNNTGLLQWQTTQELNSRSFTIEKSMDGVLFIPIGTVTAAGNSQATLNYQFTDPVLSNGNNHYRLRMNDMDGRSENSVIRIIQADNTAFNLQVFPNPVTNGILYIRSSSEISRIELADISGRMVLQRNTRGQQQSLNLRSFVKGTYLLSVYTAGSKKIQRIVIGE
ncbi:MAG: S8 family serine peptidase [Pseudobacter sp.]|uniref:S8 family serine peptidase n=1 Tax=Pseudobacter sp. TaxID=2045420 RepID=UPI003F7E7B99